MIIVKSMSTACALMKPAIAFSALPIRPWRLPKPVPEEWNKRRLQLMPVLCHKKVASIAKMKTALYWEGRQSISAPALKDVKASAPHF